MSLFSMLISGYAFASSIFLYNGFASILQLVSAVPHVSGPFYKVCYLSGKMLTSVKGIY